MENEGTAETTHYPRSVNNFSKNFPYYIKIDFEENPEAVSIFRDNDIKRITDELAMSAPE